MHLYESHEMSPNSRRHEGFTNNAYSPTSPTSPPHTRTTPSPAPRSSMNYYSYGGNGVANHAYDGNLASPSGGSSRGYHPSPKSYPASQGMRNEGYLETSLDDVTFDDSSYKKRDKDGHVNRGYIPSIAGSVGPASPTNNNTTHGANIPIYTIDGSISHGNGPNSYRPPSVESKQKMCQSRSKFFAATMAVVLAVIVIGVAVFLGIYLGMLYELTFLFFNNLGNLVLYVLAVENLKNCS